MATPPPQHSRRDLTDLRSRIFRKLGPARAHRYFSCLSRLLGQKLSKSEFDKLCILILGRENISLHNQFIRLILRNACQAKVPPLPVPPDRYSWRPGKAVGKKSPPPDDWIHPSPTVASATSVLSNGEILSPSPCRSRSTNSRFKDQSSPVGTYGTADAAIHQLQLRSDEIVGSKYDVTAAQHQQHGEIAPLPTKKQRVDKLLTCDQFFAHNEGSSKAVIVENGEDLERTECPRSKRGLIYAPPGIPSCPGRDGGARRPSHVSLLASNDGFAGSSYSGELCHTEALKKRMEQIAGSQNLGDVSMECANILNHGLDIYLKRLIMSCVDLVRARTRHELIQHSLLKQQSLRKTVNGIWQGNHMHVQGHLGSLERAQEANCHHQVSMLDFRVAMELNPMQLGEHWPMLLEKVYIHSFEE